MQLINDASKPELMAKNATLCEVIPIAKMVDKMNESLKSEGYEYRYMTDFIEGCVYIRKLS